MLKKGDEKTASDSNRADTEDTKTSIVTIGNKVLAAADLNEETFEREAEDEEVTGEKYAEIVDEVPRETRMIHKIEKILRLLKIALLLVLWTIMTYFLMTTFNVNLIQELLNLPAGGETDFNLPELPTAELFGIRLNGPFVPLTDDDVYLEPLIFDSHPLTKGDAKPQWFVEVKVQLVHLAADGTVAEQKNISQTWQLELADPSKLDETHVITRDFVFKLTESATDEKFTKMRLLFTTNDAVKNIIPVEIIFDENPVPVTWGIVMGFVTIFGLYLMLFTDRINRILAATIAATTAVSILASNGSRPTMGVIMSWIEPSMLLMIFGITIIMGFFAQSGVFDWIAVYSYEIFNGHIWPPINALCGITFLLCCIFDKIIVVLMIAPVGIRLCEVMQVHPVPVFTCIICLANVGSIWTLTAAEENALIISHKYLSENGVTHLGFIAHMLPGVFLVAIQTYLQLRLNFRGIRQFHESPQVMKMQRLIKTLKRTADTMGTFSKDEKTVKKSLLSQIRRTRAKLNQVAKVDKPREDFKSTLSSLKELYPLRDKVLLVKCCIVLVWMMFFLLIATMTNWHHLSVGWIALLGALLLLILADMEDMEAVMHSVEWGTCMFLATFFVLVHCVIHLGLTKAIGDWTVNTVLYFKPENRLVAAVLLLLWTSGMASIFICNVPVASTMVHASVLLASNDEYPIPLQPMVWALTFGTCLGNSGTLISGFANVVCAGIVEHHGYKFSFKQFFEICFPITIVSLLIATIYLMLCHIVGEWH